MAVWMPEVCAGAIQPDPLLKEEVQMEDNH